MVRVMIRYMDKYGDIIVRAASAKECDDMRPLHEDRRILRIRPTNLFYATENISFVHMRATVGIGDQIASIFLEDGDVRMQTIGFLPVPEED